MRKRKISVVSHALELQSRLHSIDPDQDMACIDYGICIGAYLTATNSHLKANGISSVLSVGVKPREELSNDFTKKYFDAIDGDVENIQDMFDNTNKMANYKG